MPTYLIEVHIPDAGGFELERATRMLAAAQSRMRGQASVARTIFAGLSREDGRLVYLVEAASLDVGATHGEPGPPAGRADPRDHQPRGRAVYSAVDTHEAMVTLELKPSLLRML